MYALKTKKVNREVAEGVLNIIKNIYSPIYSLKAWLEYALDKPMLLITEQESIGPIITLLPHKMLFQLQF